MACLPSVVAWSQSDGAVPLAPGSALVDAGVLESTAEFEKVEVVYATLGFDGTPRAAWQVNRFEVSKPGQIVDFGKYDAVRNLTSQEALSLAGDAVAFSAGEGVFSYQGDLSDVELPWTISFDYELDGRPVSADELAGATGDIVICVDVARNEAAPSAFFDSFMTQITFTLPNEACSEVRADGATLALAGQDRTVAFATLPGQEASFKLTAKVRDFYMDSPQIVGLPYASTVEMPDVDGMADGMVALSDAVGQLSAGARALSLGAAQLAEGTGALSSGAAALGEGLGQLDGSSGELVAASAQIKDALSRLVVGLGGADASGVAQLGDLGATLDELALGLEQVQDAAGSLPLGYSQALGALDGAVGALEVPAVSEGDVASIGGLAQSQGTSQDVATVDSLVASYQAARALRATYDAMSPVFSGAAELLGQLSASGTLGQEVAALRQIAAGLEASGSSEQHEALAQLASGMSQLSGDYELFHAGLSQYAGGVAAIAQSFRQLSGAMAEVDEGAFGLADGAGELAAGASELSASTAQLPDAMRDKVDEMMADYDFPAFDGTSFAAAGHQQASLVQFVMSVEPIEKPEVARETQGEAEQSIWDRLKGLFAL